MEKSKKERSASRAESIKSAYATSLASNGKPKVKIAARERGKFALTFILTCGVLRSKHGFDS